MHVVIVLFKGPFIECVCVYAPTSVILLTDDCASSRYVPHTTLLAFLLALYTIFPPAYVLGPPRLDLPLLVASTDDAVVQNDLWVQIFVESEYIGIFSPFRASNRFSS